MRKKLFALGLVLSLLSPLVVRAEQEVVCCEAFPDLCCTGARIAECLNSYACTLRHQMALLNPDFEKLIGDLPVVEEQLPFVGEAWRPPTPTPAPTPPPISSSAQTADQTAPDMTVDLAGHALPGTIATENHEAVISGREDPYWHWIACGWTLEGYVVTQKGEDNEQ